MYSVLYIHTSPLTISNSFYGIILKYVCTSLVTISYSFYEPARKVNACIISILDIYLVGKYFLFFFFPLVNYENEMTVILIVPNN